MNELNNKKVNYISFHKRFMSGEQDIYISKEGKIEKEPKLYFWQERTVYNHIHPIIETIKLKNPNLTEAKLYGKNGIVSQLVPIQRAYNAIKNRKHEYLNRIAMGVLMVEDGSIDVDNIEEEGIAPGKVIVYRQGSIPPKLLEQETTCFNIFDKEEDRLLAEFINRAQPYLKKEEI